MCGILVIVVATNYYMIVITIILGILFYKIRGWYMANARDIKHLEGISECCLTLMCGIYMCIYF